jgi:hypothetical protein
MSAPSRFAEVIATNINIAIRKALSKKLDSHPAKFAGWIKLWEDVCLKNEDKWTWLQGFLSAGDDSLERSTKFLLDH